MMIVKVDNRKLTMKPRMMCLSLIICFFMFIQTSHQQNNVTCPFNYIYVFGDGITDIGNSVKILPFGPLLPSTRPPYGNTFPRRPTGRWSDGRIDIDYLSADLGLPNILPYLSTIARKTRNDGVIFAVANSPTLDPTFFRSRGVEFPLYAVPLSGQVNWFRSYLASVCSTPQDCANRLKDSLIILGDYEGNDFGYALAQGKSIAEVTPYVPLVIQALIQAGREFLRMGATRVVISGSVPLGCYPYILTALQNNNSTTYDGLGCAKNVNDFIVSKNALLQSAVTNLSSEFPNALVAYADLYTSVQTILTPGSTTLKACCGIGGKYNYDSRRFCGSPGVPVCANPSDYIYWDGLHFTQEAYHRFTDVVVAPFLPVLGCIST